MLYGQDRSITFFERSRVVALAVVKALTKVCDYYEVIAFLLGEECSCACFRGVDVYRKVFRKIGKLKYGRLSEQLFHCCVRLIVFWFPTFSDFFGGLVFREGCQGCYDTG